MEELRERFVQSIAISDGCWYWKGDSKLFRIRKEVFRIPKASWKLFKGDLPVRRVITHACGDVQCINPDHLEAIDPSWNAELLDKRYGKKWLRVLLLDAEDQKEL